MYGIELKLYSRKCIIIDAFISIREGRLKKIYEWNSQLMKLGKKAKSKKSIMIKAEMNKIENF